MWQLLRTGFLTMNMSLAELNPKVSSSAGEFELAALTDGDLTNQVFLPAAKANRKAWIQFEFPKPVKVQSFTLVSSETGSIIPRLADPEVTGLWRLPMMEGNSRTVF